MTSGQVVETSLSVTSNSPSQDYTQPDDQTLRTYKMVQKMSENTKMKYKTTGSLSVQTNRMVSNPTVTRSDVIRYIIRNKLLWLFILVHFIFF